MANLDPATGKSTIALIDEIYKTTNKTIIIIEHRLEDVLYKDVDRVVMINDGRITADMTSDELLSSDLLEKAGIREPLYLSACKLAGVKITPDMHPSHIETFDVSGVEHDVQKWFHETAYTPENNTHDTILSVKHLSYSYDQAHRVLDDISFDIKEGEMLSIVGRNGAGKSTLSSLICGFMPVDEGEILLEGEDITPLSIRECGEKIGFVMQNPNHMISKSMIFDEVALGLEVRGVPEDEIKERVNETLKICGLYPFRNWPISALSFGQKKRMTIASILVLNPKILILDEPTAGQDFRHYTEIMEFLKMLNRDHHVTIIMITHDMHLMLEYTHRAIVLADGHLLADETPARVLTDEKLTEAAYLKRTSLYDLSLKCHIDDASAFVERFIAEDERERDHG